MYIIKATEPALRRGPTGDYIIKEGWQLAYTPGQSLKVLSSLEADLIANKQDEYPVPYVLWNRTSIEALVKSNGLIETADYAAGAPPSSRVRYTSEDTRYLVAGLNAVTVREIAEKVADVIVFPTPPPAEVDYERIAEMVSEDLGRRIVNG